MQNANRKKTEKRKKNKRITTRTEFIDERGRVPIIRRFSEKTNRCYICRRTRCSKIRIFEKLSPLDNYNHDRVGFNTPVVYRYLRSVRNGRRRRIDKLKRGNKRESGRQWISKTDVVQPYACSSDT